MTNVSRAQFSPVFSHRNTRRADTRANAFFKSNFRTPDVPKDPREFRALIPAWHRSPLDRLQPILTRHRD